MEIEKKKCRPSKRVYHGPTIRYHSMSMPMIEELPAPKNCAGTPKTAASSNTAKPHTEDPLNVSGIVKLEDDEEADDDDGPATTATNDAASSRTGDKPERTGAQGPRCERTFITFENDLDERAFEAHFPRAASRPRRPRGNTVCPITRQPARYFDPITQLPYRNKQAFKILREAYYQQLEERANPHNAELQRWLTWRRRVKEQRACNKMVKSAACETVDGV